MVSIADNIGAVFSPPKRTEIDFNAAVEAVDTQRSARITKIALFALTSLAATVAVVLSEAAIIAFPITLTIMAIVLVAGAIIYRINSLDQKYIEDLTDEKRSQVTTAELERVFHSQKVQSDENVGKSLNDLNLVLGTTIFDAERIATILMINREISRSKTVKSIAEMAAEQLIPIDFSCSYEWEEPSRFGLEPFRFSLEVSWSPTPGSTKVAFTTAKVEN